MPYVRATRGASAIAAVRLAGYARAVRARGPRRGMGQDTVDIGGGDTLDVGSFSLPPDTGIVDTGGGGGSSFDWTKLATVLTGGAAAGSQIFRSLQPPSLVPGTQAIFNPATGQFYNPTTGQVVNPTGVVPTSNVPLMGLSNSPLLLAGGIGLGVVLLIAVMGRGKS